MENVYRNSSNSISFNSTVSATSTWLARGLDLLSTRLSAICLSHRSVAMLFAVLALSVANIGMAWGAEKTYTVQNPAASKRYVQDNIMMTGTTATSKKIANSSQNVFYLQNGNYAPTCVISKAANIKKVVIYGNRDSGSSSQGAAFDLQASTNAIDFSVPTSGFTATKQDNGDPAALGSLSAINMIGNNQSYATTITVTFTEPVMAIRLVGTTSVSIKSIAVTYDDAITVDPELCEVHMTSTTAAALTGTGTWTATNIQSGNNYTDASSNTYYYDKSSGTYGKIDLGAGNTFQEGDEIWFEMNGNGLRAPGACGYRLNSSNSTSGAVTIQPTCSIAANMPMFMHYVTKSTDPWVGQQVLWILRYDSNDRLYQVTIHRDGAAPVPSCDGITPSLSYDHPTLVLTQTTSATPTLNKDGSSGAVTWTSSNTGVATVDPATGIVTAVAAGTTTITAAIAADGEDYCAGEATATIKVMAAPSGLVDQQLATGNVAWDASVIVTSDPTNVTSLTALSQHGSATASGNGNTSNGGQTSKIGTETGDFNASNYLELSFTVASGKSLNVSSVTIPVQPVSSNTNNFKAVLSDNQGSTEIIGTTTNQTNGTLANIGFASYGTLKGTITLRIYAWGWSNGYRLGKNIIINGTLEDDGPCVAPTSVSVDGTWRRFPGETIVLTATPTGGTGTPSYQWQKYMVDTWTNLPGETSATFTKSNCTTSDAGSYRCKVSTGADCDTYSDAFDVRVFTIEGGYDGGSMTSNNISLTSGMVGTASINLATGRIYRFRVIDNFDKAYGNEGRILANVSGWDFWSDNGNSAYLFTGPAGNYTFTVDITHADADPTPYVTVNVAYPEVSHPAEGYAYFQSAGWGSVGLYMWYEGGGSFTAWDDSPLITNTTSICGNTYYYTPLIPDWYNRVIFRNKSDAGQTSDVTVSGLASYSAKYVTSSNGTWQSFNTYTITFDAGGGTGTMSPINGICPNTDQTITANAFTRGGYTFAGWHANVATTVGGATVAIGGDIANEATLQNINSNITLTAQWEESEDCDELAAVVATSTSAFTAAEGSVQTGSLKAGTSISIDGYNYAVGLNASGYVKLVPKTGKTFEVGDSLIVVVYNPSADPAEVGFTMDEDSYSATGVAGHGLHYFRQLLTAANLSISYATGNVIVEHGEGDGYIVAATVKRCGYPCTTPVIPSLSNQTLCAGETGTAWNATQTASLKTGETVTYSWRKSGSNTVLSTSATYTPTNVTTAMAGTYIVTATVSKEGKLPTSATREVTLSVIPTTATPVISISPDPAVPSETVTMTASSSTGATFEWFTCTNSVGAGAVSAGTGSSLTTGTLNSGTYYYKIVATGDGTNSCGTSEIVYPLEVAFHPDCYEWAGDPHAWSVGDTAFSVSQLVLNTNSSAKATWKTDKGMWSGGANKNAIVISSSGTMWLEGHLADGKDISSITISASNNQDSGDYDYVILYCPDDGFTDDVTYDTHKAPSYKSSYDASKLIHTFTPPSGTKYFRIYKKVKPAGASSNVGDGQTTWIWGVEVCDLITCSATSMTVSAATASYVQGSGASFTEPTFTVKDSEGDAFSPQPALTYSSSDTEIATVNASTGEVSFTGGLGSVTITATYGGDGVNCEASASYVITVTCLGGEDAPKIVADPGTNLSGCNSSITLYARQQDGSPFADGSYQWYRDGEPIEENGNSASYVVVLSGTYTVVRTGNCTQASTNSAVVTNDQEEASVERLVPFQYYHVDKTYTDQMKMRHLFAVKSIGSLDGKTYSMTATRNGSPLDLTSGYDDVFELVTGVGGYDTVMINLNELNGKFSAGDEIEFTCSAINCSAVSPFNADIIMYVIDATPTLAYICSGADGDGTKKKSEMILHGDFLTGYNKADLCDQTGQTLFDKNTELPFYTYIKTRYRVTPVNGYAPFNKLNYEPFDLLLLTDYPKAKLGKEYGKDARTTAATDKLDSMYVLADYRPMLSFKTHMVSKPESSWGVKGFTTAPVVPSKKSGDDLKPIKQTSMNIVCYSHPMFNALSIGEDGVYRDNDEPDQVVYKMLDDGGYDNGKGIQGFELGDAGNFVTIAFTHYNALIGDPVGNSVSWVPGSNPADRKLVSSCERQVNIEARMILISVNADALCKMTTAGMVVVDSALQYLLITDSEKLADCSLIFNDNHGTHNWSDPLNWGPRYNQIPNADLGAHIIRPCIVDIPTAVTLNIKIEETGKLTIPVGSALNVSSTIRRHVNRTQLPTTIDDISIEANENGCGTLIFNNNTGDTKASVQMFSKAETDGSDNKTNWKWQYIGTPFNDVENAMLNYYQSWIYSWNGDGWSLVPKGSGMTPFTGYCITHPEVNHTYNMSGTLATTATQEISVPAGGYMVVGNSWTAPIQIKNFEDGDLTNITDKSIYFFNTGSDPKGTGTVNEYPTADEDTRYAPATYISVPIHAATYVGDSIIPAMQGFYVAGGSEEGTLKLEYDKLVRPKKSWQNILSGPMYAPRRIASADGEPTVAKLWVCGTNYDDRLVLLEREDFTRTYDNGWDGEKWEGNAISPMLYALNENGGQEAVTATPDMDGTVIGFRAGEDDEYMFRFNYDGMAEPIYLLDTETQIYTRVLTGNTYTFTCADKDAHNRFLLTRSEGNQVPTGVDNTSDSKDSAKPFKFIGNKKLFIFVNGILYDGTGKRVEERRAAQ